MSKLLSMMMKEKAEYMPLTVVGSPTITDGIVSEFKGYPNVNSGWYVKAINVTYENTYEIKLAIITGESFGGFVLGEGVPIPAFGLKNISLRETQYSFRLLDENGQDILNFDNSYYLNGLQLSANTKYILTLKFTGTEYLYTLEDENGVLYINRNVSSTTSTKSGTISFGVSYIDVAYGPFQGSIDFNKSYIILDETKYLFQLPQGE